MPHDLQGHSHDWSISRFDSLQSQLDVASPRLVQFCQPLPFGQPVPFCNASRRLPQIVVDVPLFEARPKAVENGRVGTAEEYQVPLRPAHGYIQQAIRLARRPTCAIQHIRHVGYHHRIELTPLCLVDRGQNDLLVADEKIRLLELPQPVPFIRKHLPETPAITAAGEFDIPQELPDPLARMGFRRLSRRRVQLVAPPSRLRPQLAQGIPPRHAECSVRKYLEERADRRVPAQALPAFRNRILQNVAKRRQLPAVSPCPHLAAAAGIGQKRNAIRAVPQFRRIIPGREHPPHKISRRAVRMHAEGKAAQQPRPVSTGRRPDDDGDVCKEITHGGKREEVDPRHLRIAEPEFAHLRLERIGLNVAPHENRHVRGRS